MRLFAGIALDPRSREACAKAAADLQRTGFAARYEDADKLHVTLAFLGNVEAERHDTLAGIMERVASQHQAFRITFDTMGAFPNERRPRVVFVGARNQGAAFRALANDLRGAYTAIGFAFKDDPVAHVTIARVKDPRCPLPQVPVAPHALDVNALTLFESIFDKERNTSRYVMSATWRLSPCA